MSLKSNNATAVAIVTSGYRFLLEPIDASGDIEHISTKESTNSCFNLRDAMAGTIDNHLDLAAINPVSKTVLLVEATRLYSSEKARMLGQDWRRLESVTITSELRQIPHGLFSFIQLEHANQGT
jgi:hypothetical protein